MFIEKLIAELGSEAETTRRVLERVPEDKLSWRPHPKSLSLGQLAHHISVLPRGIADLLSKSESEPPNVPRPEAASRAELLDNLEASLEHARAKLLEWGDAGLDAPWRLIAGGRTLIESPRGDVFRSIMRAVDRLLPSTRRAGAVPHGRDVKSAGR